MSCADPGGLLVRRTQTGLLSALLVIFALVGGGVAQADHAWYHWATTDGVVELYADVSAVKGDWVAITGPVLESWNQPPPGQPDHVVLTTSPSGSQGMMTVRSGNYGATGWLGIAEVKLDRNLRIVEGRVSLNDWYWRRGAVADSLSRRHVYCQEVGHILGLEHQYRPGDSCMNDEAQLGQFVQPNSHDFQQLASLYSQRDGYNSGTLGGSASRASRARAENWVVVHAFPAPSQQR